MNKYGWFTLGFSLFLIGIILLANSGAQIIWRFARFPMADKAGHFILFGSLAFLLNMALHCRTKKLLGKEVLIGSLGVIIVVALEEISQIFLVHRTFDLTDFMYDCAGIYLGGYLAVILREIQGYFQKRTENVIRMHQF